jgi:xanthine dehydrogenase YagS FAD-binding subunit
MKAFEYANPATTAEAVRLLSGADGDTAGLSGGTDLLSRMKDYVTSPARVVYLKDIPDLAGISESAGGLVIGAGTRLTDLIANKGVAEKYPSLRQAAVEVGTPQIRNMATVGGNLLQRPRCWYFRSGLGLLGLKDGKSLVRTGDNRYHSIFMTDGDALFTNPSSLATPLVALGATATIAGERGERTIPVAKLYQVPRTEKDRELTVAPGELLTKVTIPAPKGKNASYEARQKQAHDWPIVLCSVNLELNDFTVQNATIILTGVAPIPWKSEAAEQAIKGQKLTELSAAAAGEAAVKGAKPLSMNAYKVALTKTVVKRALLAAVGNRYWEEV